jgi:hypothetical protein
MFLYKGTRVSFPWVRGQLGREADHSDIVLNYFITGTSLTFTFCMNEVPREREGWMSNFADRATREMDTVVRPYEKHGLNTETRNCI